MKNAEFYPKRKVKFRAPFSNINFGYNVIYPDSLRVRAYISNDYLTCANIDFRVITLTELAPNSNKFYHNIMINRFPTYSKIYACHRK